MVVMPDSSLITGLSSPITMIFLNESNFMSFNDGVFDYKSNCSLRIQKLIE